MKIEKSSNITKKSVEMEGAKDVDIRWLISKEDGAENFAMRMFEFQPGGHTPLHTHPHEHEVFVLEGEGVVLEDDLQHPLRPGTVVFVPPKQPHQFRNTGAGPLKFLCLVPHPLRGMTDSCAAACGCE